MIRSSTMTMMINAWQFHIMIILRSLLILTVTLSSDTQESPSRRSHFFICQKIISLSPTSPTSLFNYEDKTNCGENLSQRWEMAFPAIWKIGVTIAFWNLTISPFEISHDCLLKSHKTARCKPRVNFGLHFWRQKAKILFEPTHPCHETGEFKCEGIMFLSWTLDIRLAVTAPQGQHS